MYVLLLKDKEPDADHYGRYARVYRDMWQRCVAPFNIRKDGVEVTAEADMEMILDQGLHEWVDVAPYNELFYPKEATPDCAFTRLRDDRMIYHMHPDHLAEIYAELAMIEQRENEINAELSSLTERKKILMEGFTRTIKSNS